MAPANRICRSSSSSRRACRRISSSNRFSTTIHLKVCLQRASLTRSSQFSSPRYSKAVRRPSRASSRTSERWSRTITDARAFFRSCILWRSGTTCTGERPWIARSLYKAFCEAKDMALRGLYDTDALRLALPWLIDHIEEARRELGHDFWVYGLEPNRPALSAICNYVYEQGLAPRLVEPDELFLPMHDEGSSVEESCTAI